MDPVRTIKLRWVLNLPGDADYGLTRFWIARRPAPTWQPAINVYRCEDCIRICVDLAGVNRADLDLQLEPKSAIIRGRREVPERNDSKGRAVQMLIMEIDYGFFANSVSIFSPLRRAMPTPA